jgi:L-amino acid N-acyltransferase YncA
MDIRPATAADHDALWAIWSEVVSSGVAFAYDEQTTRDQAIDFWYGSSTCCWVATDSVSQVTGSYYLRPNQPGRGNHVANAGYMVSADGQGHGVGRALAEHSIAEARRLGFSAMQFNFVVASNTAAVALWQRLGFRVIGTIPAAFRHADLGMVDALVMHRFLDEGNQPAQD